MLQNFVKKKKKLNKRKKIITNVLQPMEIIIFMNVTSLDTTMLRQYLSKFCCAPKDL